MERQREPHGERKRETQTERIYSRRSGTKPTNFLDNSNTRQTQVEVATAAALVTKETQPLDGRHASFPCLYESCEAGSTASFSTGSVIRESPPPAHPTNSDPHCTVSCSAFVRSMPAGRERFGEREREREREKKKKKKGSGKRIPGPCHANKSARTRLRSRQQVCRCYSEGACTHGLSMAAHAHESTSLIWCGCGGANRAPGCKKAPQAGRQTLA